MEIQQIIPFDCMSIAIQEHDLRIRKSLYHETSPFHLQHTCQSEHNSVSGTCPTKSLLIWLFSGLLVDKHRLLKIHYTCAMLTVWHLWFETRSDCVPSGRLRKSALWCVTQKVWGNASPQEEVQGGKDLGSLWSCQPNRSKRKVPRSAGLQSSSAFHQSTMQAWNNNAKGENSWITDADGWLWALPVCLAW